MAIPLLNCEVFAAEPAAQKLIPADEGESDASFRAFREQLLKAVREHDAGVIREILDPKIVLAYPDEEKKIRKFGTADFMKMWQPDNDYTPLWDTLETILLMGGTFTDEKKGQYVTPYVYSLWPKDIEPSEYSAIVGTHINVREQPDFNSQVIARLSHDIVKVDYKASQEKWRKIITGDGKAGYVFEAFIRSKYDWSAGFAKTGEKWVMKWLVSKPLSRRIPYPEP
jgi:hypothetical protein